MKTQRNVELHIIEICENSEKHVLKLTIKFPPEKLRAVQMALETQLKKPFRATVRDGKWQVTVSSARHPVAKLKMLAANFWELMHQ